MQIKPSAKQIEMIKRELQLEGPFPTKTNAEKLRVSFSHLFRNPETALRFAKNILLNPDESIISGCTRDSVGALWWIGIKVDTLEQWQKNGGYHHSALHDPETPEENMLC